MERKERSESWRERQIFIPLGTSGNGLRLSKGAVVPATLQTQMSAILTIANDGVVAALS